MFLKSFPLSQSSARQHIGKITIQIGFVLTLLFSSTSFCLASDVVEVFNFENITEGWKSYRDGKDGAANLVLAEADGGDDSRLLKVSTPGEMTLEGIGRDIDVEPGNRYVVTAQVKGKGRIFLAAHCGLGWNYSNHVVLKDFWQEIKLSVFARRKKLNFNIITHDSPQKSFFFVKSVKVGKITLDYPANELRPERFEAVEFYSVPANCPGKPTIGVEKGSRKYVEGSRRGYYGLARGIPFPRTSKPVFVYLRVWTSDDSKSHINLCSHLPYQRVGASGKYVLPKAGNWGWIKAGPFAKGEIFDEMSVFYQGSDNVITRLSDIIISTDGKLAESKLETGAVANGFIDCSDIVFSRIPLLDSPPIIDGQMQNEEWRGAALFENFIRASDSEPTIEPTSMRIGFTEEKIFIGLRMASYALNPSSNMRQEFRTEARERNSKKMWNDDYVEIRLAPESADGKIDSCYFIAFNALETLYELILNPGGGSDGGNWRSRANLKVRLCESGYWEAELALPFKSMNTCPVKHRNWRFNVVRFETRLKEKTSWIRLREGNHTDLNNLGLIEFDKAAPAVQDVFKAASDRVAGNFPFGIYSDKPARVKWSVAAAVAGGYEILNSRYENIPSEGKIFPISSPQDRAADSYRLFVNDSLGDLLYASPEYPVPTCGETVTMSMRTQSPVDAYWNQERIELNVRGETDDPLPLNPGINVLAIRIKSSSLIHARIKSGKDTLISDSSWRYAELCDGWNKMDLDDSKWRNVREKDYDGDNGIFGEGMGDVVVRKKILHRVSAFFPTVDSRTPWFLTHNGVYAMHWNGRGAAVWKGEKSLDDFSIVVELPPGLKMVGIGSNKKAVYPEWRHRAGFPKEIPVYDWTEMSESDRHENGYRVYRIQRSAPARIATDEKRWFQREVMERDGFVVAVKADAPAGARLTINHRIEAGDGFYRELMQSRPVEILPEIAGRQPEKMVFFMNDRINHLDQENVLGELLKTIKSAGVTEIWGYHHSLIPKKVGLNQTYFLNLHEFASNKWDSFNAAILDMTELFRDFPHARAVNFSGGHSRSVYSGSSVCMAYIARHPETWPYIERAMRDMMDRNPSLTHLFWDYEFSPFPGHHPRYPLFSEFGIQTFKKQHGIDKELTPAAIREKYEEEWVDYACGEMAQFSGILRKIAHDNGLLMTVYSGYQQPYTKHRYGVDWEKLATNIDRANCGYGHDNKLIADTLAALNGVPLVGGLLTSRSNMALFNTPAELMRKIIDCGGGVLCWYEAPWDGRALSSIAEISDTVAEFEKLMLAGGRNDKAVSVHAGIPASSAILYEYCGSFVLFLLNETDRKREVSFSLPLAKDMVVEYRAQKSFGAHETIFVKIPPGSVRTFSGRIREDAGTR